MCGVVVTIFILLLTGIPGTGLVWLVLVTTVSFEAARRISGSTAG